MSEIDIIEQLKSLPKDDRRSVYRYLSEELKDDNSLFDEFSILGNDSTGSDVDFASAAQNEVIRNERR